MSTILKALKKLEERKAADGKRQGDIAWDILREDSTKRPAAGRQPFFVLLLLVCVSLLVLLAWLFWTPRHTFSVTPEPRTLTNPAATPVAPPPTTPVAPQPSKQVAPPMPLLPEKPAPADVTGQLTVSGIAFHQDRGARMAIVNDLPVMVGTMIDGYVVERIESDRVEFSRDGERFSVSLAEDL